MDNMFLAITEPCRHELDGFVDGEGNYQYDANGNMTYDPDKGFTVYYNYLNLPDSVVFDSSRSIRFTYDANGTKLKKWNSIGVRKDYINGVEYSSGSMEAIYHAEGRAVPDSTGGFRYEYTLTDHLGNSRAMFSDLNGDESVDGTEILQENHYYPFGMNMKGDWGAGTNSYQYTGKELNTDLGLGWNDYGARWYDASLGRFTSVDPLAEKYTSWSPYHYTYNNPLKFIDPDGMRIIVGKWHQFKFRRQIKKAIRQINKSSAGREVITYLRRGKNSEGNKFNVRIIKQIKGVSPRLKGSPTNTAATSPADLNGKESSKARRAALQKGLATERSDGKTVGTGKGASSNVYIDSNPELKRPENGTVTSTLGHEFQHVYDNAEGELNPNTMDPIGDDQGDKNGRGAQVSEYKAVLFENKIRAANGLEERNKYGDRVIVPEKNK